MPDACKVAALIKHIDKLDLTNREPTYFIVLCGHSII